MEYLQQVKRMKTRDDKYGKSILMRNRKFAVSFGLHFTFINISQDGKLLSRTRKFVVQCFCITKKPPYSTTLQFLYVCSLVRTSGKLSRGQ